MGEIFSQPQIFTVFVFGFTNKQNKQMQLRIIKKREMWKYDLKDWLYDSGEGGEEGHEEMINS